MKKLGIYIHIPFCVRKCQYCDFLSFPLAEYKEIKESYLEALLDEITKSKQELSMYEADTVFFGGGTPSLLKGEEIERILNALRETIRMVDDVEITIEANPGTVDEEKLLWYKKAGVNRLSFGLQSANDEELKLLGRVHTYARFEESMILARKCGFDNINIDIMSALPYQTLETYHNTLKQVLKVKPEHISAYSLIVEEGTPFYERFGDDKGEETLPDEETDRQMYEDTLLYLQEEGYHRYEISNYAKEGYECRHNLKYWTLSDYAGFGLGSASLIGNSRIKNTEQMHIYLDTSRRKEQRQIEILSEDDRMEEFMFLGLRTMQGVSKEMFYVKFGIKMEEVYGDILNKYEVMKLLENGENVRLTRKGLDVSNVIMADFLR